MEQRNGRAGVSAQKLVVEGNPLENGLSTSPGVAAPANMRLWRSQPAATWMIVPASYLTLPRSGDPGPNVPPLKRAAGRVCRPGARASSAVWVPHASRRMWWWCRAATQSHAHVPLPQPNGPNGANALQHVEGGISRGQERLSWELGRRALSSAISRSRSATWTNVLSVTSAPGGSSWAEKSLRKKIWNPFQKTPGAAMPTFLYCQQRRGKIWSEWGQNMLTCSPRLGHSAVLAFFSQAWKERWEQRITTFLNFKTWTQTTSDFMKLQKTADPV